MTKEKETAIIQFLDGTVCGIPEKQKRQAVI